MLTRRRARIKDLVKRVSKGSNPLQEINDSEVFRSCQSLMQREIPYTHYHHFSFVLAFAALLNLISFFISLRNHAKKSDFTNTATLLLSISIFSIALISFLKLKTIIHYDKNKLFHDLKCAKEIETQLSKSFLRLKVYDVDIFLQR